MPVIVLDTESTGFVGVPKSSVVEVGAVSMSDTGKMLGTFSALVRPTFPLGPWSEPAMAVHKLDPKLLSSAAPPEKVWSSLLSWMSLHSPVHQVLAFNLPFDRGIMVKTFPPAEHLPWGPCIMRSASEHIRQNRASISLEAAAQALGLQRGEESHRALSDALLASRIWAAVFHPHVPF